MDLFGEGFEEPMVLESGLCGSQVLDLDASFLLFVAVAFVAVFAEKGRCIAGEIILRTSGDRGEQDHGNEAEISHGWRLEGDGGGRWILSQ